MSNAVAGPEAVEAVKGDVVFIGNAAELDGLRDLIIGLGYGHAVAAEGELHCAVVDDDVLDGICTAAQAALLVRIRSLGIPVLTVDDARNQFRIATELVSPT
ncbi:hypothetical protein ERC79_08580 [Rhodococcus sp. ABRD24]|uniref:hypothetical protein n=1 Tax=Rhodococcus sp. ABRD24 TaxID=2507582 RepID=UPI00103C4AAC|nr:hypothetical protein [Rhodococcus sp. ABRD24]QBJ96021.1 hypothetical protein ERC79_08580 [Rhodococcus sp. ABRD24]